MRVRAFVTVLTLAAVVLSGCASEASEKEPVQAIPEVKPGIVGSGTLAGLNGTLYDLLPEEVPTGALRYLGVSTFEPTVGSDADGCLYYTHYRGTGTGTRIYMSCDVGATWNDIGPNLVADGPAGDEPCFRNSNDPFVHVDKDTGRVFSSDLHALVTSTLHFTDDKGETWTCNVLGGGLPPGVHDHQSVTTGVPRNLETVGYPNMVYYCVNRVADSWCSTSINGGLGFGPAITVFTGVSPRGGPTSAVDNVCGGLTGHVETDHEGRVYFPRSYCGEAMVGISEDDGVTWTTSTIDSTVGVQQHEVRIAADAAGNVYAFWVGADYKPYLSVSKDHGSTWSTPVDVAPPEVTGAGRPAIAAGADGSVVVAYIGFENAAGPETPAEKMEWYAYLGVLYNAADEAPTVFTAKPIDTPIDAGRDCSSARCGGIGDFIDVTIDPEGRPWAAFSNQCGTDACAGGVSSNNAFVATLESGRSLSSPDLLTPLSTISLVA